MKRPLSTIFTILFFSLPFAVSVSAQTDNSKVAKKAETADQKKTDEQCPEKSVARVKVTFHKSGKVTDVELVLSAGCKRFDEQALKAARRIKFEPAKKNGKKVTTTKVVEYTATMEN